MPFCGENKIPVISCPKDSGRQVLFTLKREQKIFKNGEALIQIKNYERFYSTIFLNAPNSKFFKKLLKSLDEKPRSSPIS